MLGRIILVEGVTDDVDNVSPDFRWNKKDLQTIKKVLPHEATPEAIKVFARYAWRLTDYGYWFLLSTLWVSYCRWMSECGDMMETPYNQPRTYWCVIKEEENVWP